ncbi:hypothetical protein M1513_01605 [Patescibacteria group bacterium]|nr:hypothetical protein [Patescibacteria group bacterium]MCL5733632.1 hypothetical protein [Patescibacteria group bacterium]
MSLTSFLADKEVRDKFAEQFPLPEFDLKGEILAPPLTDHYLLIGTAFDYLMRFYLKFLNPNAITQTWIAENAVSMIPSVFPDSDIGKAYYQRNDVWQPSGFTSKNINMPICLAIDIDKSTEYVERIVNGKVEVAIGGFEEIQKIAKEIIQQAKENYLLFLKAGKINNNIIKSALLLAQLDPIYRAAYIDKNIGKIDSKDVDDLKRLISIINPKDFKALKYCLLNPTFGKASASIGGADADICIDDKLIDIKTTKFLKLDRKFFNQIIGYYILSKIGNINGLPHKSEITDLGIYFSRYGKLSTFKVANIIDIKKLPNFIKWFNKKVRELD